MLPRSNLGRRIDIRFVEYEEYYAALIYFTGSKNFNIDLRNKAIELGAKPSRLTNVSKAACMIAKLAFRRSIDPRPAVSVVRVTLGIFAPYTLCVLSKKDTVMSSAAASTAVTSYTLIDQPGSKIKSVGIGT